MKRNANDINISSAITAHKEMYESRVTNNIENFIGLAKIPLGLAGPLLIHGEHARGEFHIPLATTEGTLVASASRGMKIMNESGGVTTRVSADRGIQRSPAFEFASFEDAQDFAARIVEDTPWFASLVETTTRVGKFLSLVPLVMGRFVHLRVTMQSGDAAGQNMVSVAVGHASAKLRERYPSIVRYFSDAGLSGEKMASHVNSLWGRGKQVSCSVTIPDEVLHKNTRARLADIVAWHSLFTNTSATIGWKGTSSPSVCNTLAALYIATGQDVASVSESSIAYTNLDYDRETARLRWEMTFPGLVVGTYGGGTHLPTQRAALEMLDCYGSGRVLRFAELVAATAMAAEISLIAAVCADEWIAAHERMGRNRH